MRLFLLSVVLTLICAVSEAQVKEIPLSHKKTFSKSIEQRKSSIRFNFNQEKIHSKDISNKEGNSFTDIWIDKSYASGEVGTPKLPAYKKLIIIPQGYKPTVKVNSYTEQIIDLGSQGIKTPIYPNQPSIRKDKNPADQKFEIRKESYSKQTYSNKPIATIEILGNLRSETIARLVVSPVDYNPGAGSIKVYNDISIDVLFEATGSSDTKSSAKTFSPYFDVISKSLSSATGDSYTTHPDLVKYPVKMLIVSNRMFESTLQPFIEWKRLKGFDVKVVYTDDIGTSASQIKAYVKQEYDAATPESPAPSFLIIVGDTPQVVASADGTYTGRATDLYYASVDGDMFPDMYYGRLSATTTAELANIINKILYYEKYQFADPNYLNNVTIIAGADGEWNYKVAQPTMKYGTANYFNASKGFVNVNEYGVTTDPNNPAAKSDYVGCYGTDKASVAFINYTAHGSETSWIDPALNKTTIAGLTNAKKYPFVIGNCCLTGDFGYGECLGESWIRAQNSGAIGYIGSSPNSYWLEDFYWAVGAFPMVGDNNGYVPTFSETTIGGYDAPFVSKYVTAGAIVFAGNLAVTEVDVQNYPNQSSPSYYWEAYNLLGDPSIIPYFTQAEPNQVSHSATVILEETSISVNALADSYIAISKDNQLIGTSFVSQTGDISVPITPITTTGDVVIVVTRPQTIPTIDTITAISPTGPYLQLISTTIDDHLGNANGKADYSETFGINLKIKNIGVANATNVKVKITGQNQYVNIESIDSISISDIPIGVGVNILNIANAFSFKTVENIPDQTVAKFTLKFYSDQGQWTSKLLLTLNSPVITLGDFKIDDTLLGGNKDSLVNPGETCKVLVRVINKGHAAANDITFQTIIPDSLKNLISVSTIQTEPITLQGGSFSTISFWYSANPSILENLVAPILLKSTVVLPSGLSQTFEKTINIVSNNNVKMSNDTLSTCFTYFYDSGGKTNSYSNGEKFISTFVAKNDYNWLRVRFSEFSTEKNYDYLYVYDGPSINSPQILGSPFSGTTLPPEIISRTRSLTFQFKSDNNTTAKGWVAKIECIDPQIPLCASIPSPSSGAEGVLSGSLSWSTQKYASFYDIYIGTSPTNLALVNRVDKPEYSFTPKPKTTYYWRAVPGNYFGLNQSSCDVWHFTTDSVTSSKNVLMSNQTLIVDTVLFFDTGGPLLAYKNYEDYSLTFKPKYPNDSIIANFFAFEVEGQSTCNYDKLTIYNGLSTSSPVIGYYCTTSPGIVRANNTDGALTFIFHSDENTVKNGWKAVVQSVGGAPFKTIEVNVADNSKSLANASVCIDGMVKNTDLSGNVRFSIPASTGTTISVNALGYKPQIKNVSEPETNSTINIILQKKVIANVHVTDIVNANDIPGAKIKFDNDSTYTNSSGLAVLNISQGTYTLSLNKEGYIPVIQEISITETTTEINIQLKPKKYKVSFIVANSSGGLISGAQINLSDTLLTTDSKGFASGYFTANNYPVTVSRALFIPVTFWVNVSDTITKKTILENISSLYNIHFSFTGKGPKGVVILNNNSVDLYYNAIFYSKITTDLLGKGSVQLPKGDFSYSISREGYNSIQNRAFTVDGIVNEIKDTLIQKTYSVQFYVYNQLGAIQDAIVTLNGYNPLITGANGIALFNNIGYERQIPYTVQRSGFLNASGNIDVVNPVGLNISLVSNGIETISDRARVFPNPTNDNITIIAEKPIIKISVLNTLGLVVVEKDLQLLNHTTVQLSNLPSGAYILVIHYQNFLKDNSVIIKR